MIEVLAPKISTSFYLKIYIIIPNFLYPDFCDWSPILLIYGSGGGT